MPDSGVLPYLVALADDPTPLVREAVARELDSFGSRLPELLDALSPPPTPEQRTLLADIVREHRRTWLRGHWHETYECTDPFCRLEKALSLLAAFQDGAEEAQSLGARLNQLAVAFSCRDSSHDAAALAEYLFTKRGLHSVNAPTQEPGNISLLHALEYRQGAAVVLACLYILVAKRLRLKVFPCNLPGFAMVRVYVRGTFTLIDCSQKGNCIDVESYIRMQGPSGEAAKEAIEASDVTDNIVLHILLNLARAYQQREWFPERDLLLELARDFAAHFHVMELAQG